MVKVSLREIVMDAPPQDVITRDNVSLKVNAAIYFAVPHPEKAAISVENYLFGTSQMAQTTLPEHLWTGRPRPLLAERETINRKLAEIIDQQRSRGG